MLINSHEFINNPKNNNFCSSVYTLNNPSQKTLLNNNWYFTITPFPSNQYGVGLSDVAFKDLDHENEINQNRLLDVFCPFSDQKYEKIPFPRFSAHTFILILELSEITSPFISTFFQFLREYFSQQRPLFFTILIIYGNSLLFPLISKSRKTFSISTWSDFSQYFELLQESLYFNMSDKNQVELFFTYINSIEEIKIEKKVSNVDIFDVLKSLFPFFKSLRNPIWLICSCLHINNFSPVEEVEKISQSFYQSCLNVDFYFIFSNSEIYPNMNSSLIKNSPQLQIFSTKCNCSVIYFGNSQFDRISIDIIYNFSKPRAIFTRLDIFTSNSLEISKIYGQGCQLEDDSYKSSVLTVNDTIHVFIKPNIKKLQTEVPKIVFRTRYVDGATNCFMRYVPFECSSRDNCPKAFLTAAAIKIIKENYDIKDAMSELLQLEIPVTNENVLNPILFRKRFDFAIKSLRLIKDDLWISNFVVGNCPNDVFEFLSPICSQITRSNFVDQQNESNISIGEWKIVPEVVFGSALFLIRVYEHQFIFVETESNIEKLSDLEVDQIISSIDKKGRFEIVNIKNFFENQQLVRIDSLSKNYLASSSF